MIACYLVDRQAGWRTEDLNPCLEQSRSQAASKLSSVPSFASAHFPSHTERSGHVMVDIIALSSIYLFPLLLSELEVTKWNEATHEQSMNAYCQRAQWVLSHIQRQMSVWLQSNNFLLVYLAVLVFHPHTSGSAAQVNCYLYLLHCRERQMLHADWVCCSPFVEQGS